MRLPVLWLTVLLGAAILVLGARSAAMEHRARFAGDAPPPAAPAMPSPADLGVAVLRERCLDCHGSVKQSGKLRLDSRDAAILGGKGGPSIVAGDPNASPLLKRVLSSDPDDRMPFDREPLKPEEAEALRAWIAAGSPWPTGADGAEGSSHWAYAAPKRPAVPSIPADTWSRNEIDRFVLAQLRAEGLTPSPEAPPATLLRRLCLDLTGLPPTPDQIRSFELDRSPAAYDRLVDSLLASPAYGEKWARPWLDLARYADSKGYEKDLSWSMWPYRDWVINALNADMPFDRFTTEQLAGDLLPGATQDQLIATGFNRCTMINEEGGTDPEEQRVNAVFDRTDTTATVWLGTTLACARCHDHKYDPFSQKDYYRFLAIFNSSPPETIQTDRAEIEITSVKINLPDPEKPRLEQEIDRIERVLSVATPGPGREVRALARELDRARQRLGNPPTTQAMKELDTPRQSHVMLRGSFLSPGEEVTPGGPAVLPPIAADPGPDGAEKPVNRLALARWLVSPQNPLTARVTVNRLWEQYFGRGLVETSEDFGTRGTPPTHAELLDWLATEFIARHWSVKAMHRLIVTSATYRQASEIPSELLERDPSNKLLARASRFRLEGELIRDQSLAASGLLSHKLGGPSVYPPQPPGIWATPHVSEPYTTSRGEDRYRRGIYTFWKRSSPYPTFMAFDAPQRQVACTRRSRTNTPLQALTTLNDPAFVEAAAALAHRAMLDTHGDEARATLVFQRVLTRAPERAELDRLLKLLAQQREHYRADAKAADDLLWTLRGGPPKGVDHAELAAWTIVANVILNLDETLTRP